MRQKREKIRQLYDEIDELEGSLPSKGSKAERAKIKQQVLALRQEVARLLEPETKEENPQAIPKVTEARSVSTSFESSPLGLPLGRGRVVARAPSPPGTGRTEEHSTRHEVANARKTISQKFLSKKTQLPKERVKKLQKRIQTIQDQVMTEAAKYRKASRSGSPASKTTLNELLLEEQSLKRELREAESSSQKGKRKKSKRKGQQRTASPRTNTVTPNKIRKETKEEIKSRQKRNAAYLEKFQSPENVGGYSVGEKRYWWNEE